MGGEKFSVKSLLWNMERQIERTRAEIHTDAFNFA